MSTTFPATNIRRHAVLSGDWCRPVSNTQNLPYCRVRSCELGIVRTECAARWAVESSVLYRSGDVGDRCPCCEHVIKHGGGESTTIDDVRPTWSDPGNYVRSEP